MKRYSFIIISLLVGFIYAAATIFEDNGFIFEVNNTSQLYLTGITDEKLAEARETHELTFPSKVRHYRQIRGIAPGFFDGHETDGIKKIIFPQQPKLKILSQNFCDMPDLEEVVHNGNLVIYPNCFNNLPKLKTFDFSDPSVQLAPQTFLNTGFERIKISTSYIFDFNVSTIEREGSRFCGLPNLVEIDLSEANWIPSFAFCDMPKLQELTFNGAFGHTEEGSFSNAENLQKITLKKRDKTFNIDKSFYIHESSFRNTPKLTDVYVENKKPFHLGFVGNEEGFYPPRYTLHVPIGSKAMYEAAPGWREFGQIVEDVAGVDDTLPEYLKIVTVDGFIYQIDTRPSEFKSTHLAGITDEKLAEAKTTHILEIPATIEFEGHEYKVTRIEDYFFEGRSTEGIQKIILSENLSIIHRWSICNMPDLEEVVHKGASISFSENNFLNLPKLKKFDFSQKDIYLGNHTFINVGLESIKFQAGAEIEFSEAIAESFGNFWFMPNLVEIDLADVKIIETFTFWELPKVPELTFNASLTWIRQSSFQGMESLHKITFKKRDKRFGIEVNSFEDTPALSDIYVENEIPFEFIYPSNEKAFYPPRYTLHVPPGSKALYEAAPGWCKFGQIVEDGAGVDETAAESPTWRCAAVSGGVEVVGAEGMELRIFAIDGKLVERLTPTSDCVTVPLPAGLYIVSTAGRSLKVCVR